MAIVEDTAKVTRQKMEADVARLKERASSWRKEKPKTIGFPTRLEKLDRISGGLIPGELVTLGGGTASGKTSFALQLMESVALHIRDASLPHICVYFSTEMTRFNLYLRDACRIAKLDSTEVRVGNINEKQQEEFYKALDYLLTLPYLVIDTTSMTSGDVRNTLTILTQSGQSVGLAVVDYIQFLSDEGAEGHQRISAIMRHLKAGMDESGCCLLCLSQYSRDEMREEGKRTPRLGDFKESGSIENASYQVWAMHDPQPQAKLNGTPVQRRQLFILKNRNGSVGKVDLDFHAKFTSFHSVV